MTVVTMKSFMAATGPDLDALVLKLIGWTRKPGESDGALRSAVMDVVRNEGRQFPITHCGEPRTIPWAAIRRFDEQARKNFGQSLEVLAARGGISPGEANAIIEGRPWERMPYSEERDLLRWHTEPDLLTAAQCLERATRMVRQAVKYPGRSISLDVVLELLEGAAE